MEREILQKELHAIIDIGDDALLETLHEVAKEYDEFELSEEELKELDELRQKRLSGESKTFTWEEAKEMIQQRKLVK